LDNKVIDIEDAWYKLEEYEELLASKKAYAPWR
jgi:hypothetical protein